MRRLRAIFLRRRIGEAKNRVWAKNPHSGTSSRDRMIPIGDRAMARVARYRDEVRPKLAIAGDDGTLL